MEKIPFPGGFSEAAEKANMTVSQLTLLTKMRFRDDAAAIIIKSTDIRLSRMMPQRKKEYLQGGGKSASSPATSSIRICRICFGSEAYCGIERVAGIVMENSASACYRSTP